MRKDHTDLLTVLRSTPISLRALLLGMSDEDASRAGPVPEDEWSPAAIAYHLVHAEEAWLERRVRTMAEQDDPYLPYYDDPDYSRPPPLAESLADIERRRAASVAYLEALPDEAWTRTGRHERWGPITIAWAISHVAAHDAEHLAQIARRLAPART
jgi:uncharacterized damage-inducible protein DinB